MERRIIYAGQIPQTADLLGTNVNTMVGIAKLAEAIMGTSTLFSGLACTATSPASLAVNVAPGQVYALANIDDSAYGSLSADTSHQILKQGIVLDTTTLSTPAPSTSGYSVVYLVQAKFTETDTTAVVLPYYNSVDPTNAWSGPSNAGTAQNTVRSGECTLSIKSGIAALTGTQQTPTPDAGYTGLYTVTVANGQSTVTSSNISLYSGAPFINDTIQNLASINLANVFTQPQTVPNATSSGHAINLGQAQSLFPQLSNMTVTTGSDNLVNYNGTVYSADYVVMKYPMMVNGTLRTVIDQIITPTSYYDYLPASSTYQLTTYKQAFTASVFHVSATQVWGGSASSNTTVSLDAANSGLTSCRFVFANDANTTQDIAISVRAIGY